MPEATFVLKEPKSNEPTLVYLFFRFSGQKLKFSTGQKIYPKFWNENSQSAKETRQFAQYSEFNSLLKSLRNIVETEYRSLLIDGVPVTPERLKVPLNEFLQKMNKEDNKSFLDFIDTVIRTANKRPNTIKQYVTNYNRLLEYQEYTKKKIEFDTIDLNFYEDFIKYLTNKKGYGINTVGTVIKNIKVFMNEAVERGLTTNMQFKSKRFKKTEEPSESIYLTRDEIKRLLELDLSQNKRLDKVRDLFLIGCHTGLRFSDLAQLRDENLIDNRTKVKIRTQKTGATVIIPLTSAVKNILAKYDGVPPQVISNQKMNQYLKELGQLAEIDENILITATKGGKRQSEAYKKYDLITVHTARRSFATNAYLNGVPTISIMKITGHSTEKAFMKYIKISQEDNANKLLNHPFFQ
ncbi:MAG TPA: site-specific integrase [Chitinophagaceae bacterium]|nr:site-specific integrase [Chitinophagaceae bacterium]